MARDKLKKKQGPGHKENYKAYYGVWTILGVIWRYEVF